MGGSPEARSLRPAWPTWWNPVSTKNTKISWVRWQVPVIPVYKRGVYVSKAEARESLEPKRWRLQGATLHSSLGDRVKLCLKKKVNTKYTEHIYLYEKIYLLFIHNSDLTGHPVFHLATLCARCYFSTGDTAASKTDNPHLKEFIF